MAFEIEHKYLVINDSYKNFEKESFHICQGYLSRVPERTVRVRTVNDKGFLTIKGITTHAKRHEYEYEIPFADAQELLKLCIPPIIEKIRHIVPFDNHIWEVDEFKGDLNHVVVAEIELSSVDEKYKLPPFVGSDITGDSRYYNSNIHTQTDLQ